MPQWAKEVINGYESGAAGCFVLHGNVNDRLLVPDGDSYALGGVENFILDSLLPRFDVILSYDSGQGLRIERGNDVFYKWPTMKDGADLPSTPLAALRLMTHYFKYCKNLKIMGVDAPKVGVIIHQAHLICPSLPNSRDHELNAMAAILRSWAADMRLQETGQAAFLVSENLVGLHPLVAKSPRVLSVEIPLPAASEMESALELLSKNCPVALQNFTEDFAFPASRLTGATLSSVEILLLRKEHEGGALEEGDLARLKQSLVERVADSLVSLSLIETLIK